MTTILDSLRPIVLADTTAPAYRETNLLTAPINELSLAVTSGDSIRWTAQADSCGLIVVGKNTSRRFPESSEHATLVAEWFGTAGFGDVWDIAPSPSWSWVAFGSARTVRKEADVREAAHDAKSDVAGIRRAVVSAGPGVGALSIPVVEPLLDTCSGDDCPLNAASPSFGGWRVAWTSDGKAALMGGREDSSSWTAVNPSTLQHMDANLSARAPVRWERRAVSDLVADVGHVASGGGSNAFTSRGDSLWLRGPDRFGRAAARYVGPGIPVVATRNGQYVVAVRTVRGKLEGVIYEFTLFHAIMKTSCDRPGAG